MSSIGLRADGTLYVDVHVFGEQEQAFTLYVAAGNVADVRGALALRRGRRIWTAAQMLEALAQLGDAGEIREWIKRAGIPWTYRFDDGAMLDP